MVMRLLLHLWQLVFGPCCIDIFLGPCCIDMCIFHAIHTVSRIHSIYFLIDNNTFIGFMSNLSTCNMSVLFEQGNFL